MKKILILTAFFAVTGVLLFSCKPECEKKAWYQDADNDGLGNPAVRIDTCFQPEGYKCKGVNNEGVYGITTAGGGASLYQHSEPFHPGSELRFSGHGASRITVNGSTLTHEFIAPEGEVLDTWTITK